MIKVNEYLQYLGKPCKDKVTGFSGIITSISFDLYGCIQAVVTPSVNEKGECREGRWFDCHRLNIKNVDPVMKVPEFDLDKGPENKPMFESQPIK